MKTMDESVTSSTGSSPVTGGAPAPSSPSSEPIELETQGEHVLAKPVVAWIIWVGTTIYTYALFELMLRKEWWSGVDNFRVRDVTAMVWLFNHGVSPNPVAIIAYTLMNFWAESMLVKYLLRLGRFFPYFFRVELARTLKLASKKEADAYVAARNWLISNAAFAFVFAGISYLDILSTQASFTSDAVRYSGAWWFLTALSVAFVFVGEIIYNVQKDPRDRAASGKVLQSLMADRDANSLLK